jgi:hypothetical protein
MKQYMLTHAPTALCSRCWPDGKVVWAKEDEMGGYPLCSGPAGSVAEGRKSFPSGEQGMTMSSTALHGMAFHVMQHIRACIDGPVSGFASSLCKRQ